MYGEEDDESEEEVKLNIIVMKKKDLRLKK